MKESVINLIYSWCKLFAALFFLSPLLFLLFLPTSFLFFLWAFLFISPSFYVSFVTTVFRIILYKQIETYMDLLLTSLLRDVFQKECHLDKKWKTAGYKKFIVDYWNLLFSDFIHRIPLLMIIVLSTSNSRSLFLNWPSNFLTITFWNSVLKSTNDSFGPILRIECFAAPKPFGEKTLTSNLELLDGPHHGSCTHEKVVDSSYNDGNQGMHFNPIAKNLFGSRSISSRTRHECK